MYYQCNLYFFLIWYVSCSNGYIVGLYVGDIVGVSGDCVGFIVGVNANELANKIGSSGSEDGGIGFWLIW